MDEPLAYRFGPWRLVPGQRLLEMEAAPVKLGGRAFDMLVALVEQRHRVLSKHELIDLVWPRLVVEENNLQVQMVALRKLLGHPAIATVPGRGYRFALPVEVAGGASVRLDPAHAATLTEQSAARATSAVQAGNVRFPLPQLFGRADDLRDLLSMLRQHVVVSVTGAAGIGKTRLAEAAAAHAAQAGEFAAWWVELASVSDGALVAHTVAQTLGAQPGVGRDAIDSIASRLVGRPTLLVLDNAEHVLDGVIAFHQKLSARLPQLRWLITSQEALRLPAEQVLRLNPLSLPPADASVLSGGAVELFLARVQAADPRFVLPDAKVATVLDICRQLDGIPLALELAAARVPLLGLEGVRSRLGDRFKLLSGGARAVLRRHQTLRAALEWSHALLSEPEQLVFRRLGVFVGGFTVEAAQLVAEDDTLDGWDVIEHVGSLADKSLVVTGGAGVGDAEATPRCQLLETTRLFALEQLALAGETEVTLQRHAQALRTLLGLQSPLTRAWFSSGTRRAELAAEVPNVRAACEWASASGDASTAVMLHGAVYSVFSAAASLRDGVSLLRLLAGRIDATVPTRQVAQFWKVAATASGGRADRFCLHAAEQAVALWRELGDASPRLEALAVAVGLRARMGELDGLETLIDEGRAIERPDFSANLRSNFHWAQHRYWLARGLAHKALASALAQAEVVAGRSDGFEHVLLGGNAAWCELAMGDAPAAERRANAAVQALRALGNEGNHLGYPLQVLAEAVLAQGRIDEGVALAREAQPRLAADSDDVVLLEPLALAAASRGRADVAARLVGHVDAAYATSGQRHWPFEAERRAEIDRLAIPLLCQDRWQSSLSAGRDLSREQAFALTWCE